MQIGTLRSSRLRRPWRAAALALLGWSCGLAAAAPPPVEHFVRQAAIGSVAISPSGSHLAVTAATANGRAQLAVLKLDPLGSSKVVAAFSDADIERAAWVNDTRLVFWVSSRDRTQLRSRVEGVYAVDADGGNQRELIADDARMAAPSSTIIERRVLPSSWYVHSTLDDGSADLIVGERHYESNFALREVVLHRLDTLTGRTRSISDGAPPQTVKWVLDADARPRFVVSRQGGRSALHWREKADGPYAEVASFETFAGKGLAPIGLDDDGALLVLAARGRDTQALYRFDPRARKLEGEPLVALKDFDLEPVLERDSRSRRLVGLHLSTERPASVWFDAEFTRLQAGVDSALPGRFNRLHCGRCSDTRFLVVASSSNRLPVEYHLLDRKTMKMQFIARSRPWIDEAQQPTRSFHRVPARDGLSLPVYLTRPAAGTASAALPAVVMVHGGPSVRGHELGWQGWGAFLASRGYLVIEVDFRGSQGYGAKHFRAGWKQWGLAMQDDLADAVAWAAREGLADARRVCIMGGSYGGYAALMGPVRHPDAYRCAVAFASVTDIGLMYDIGWSDFSDTWRQYGMPVLIGDPKADAAQLAATSPLQQVARIKVPLLVAHGGLDRRVPIEHSNRFRAAAEAAKVPIDYVVYPDEGHGFYQPEHAADFLGKVEQFLARQLQGAAR